MVGIDVSFRRDVGGNNPVKWNYTNAAPANNELDFESIALHELMHGAQLNHVLNQDDVMYYAYTYGIMRRVPQTCSDVLGLKYIVEESLALNANCDDGNSYKTPSSFAGYQNINFNACPASIECNSEPVVEPNQFNSIRINALLEGMLQDNSLLRTDLNTMNLMPNQQPFSGKPWYHNGDENITDKISSTVDWILLELRNVNDPKEIILQKAVLLNQSGQLTMLDGSTEILFDKAFDQDYFIALHHRSHLSIISNKINLAQDSVYDFTTGKNQAQGIDQMVNINGKFAMYGGDYDCNGVINVNDYNKWRSNSSVVSQYVSWDGDGNGMVNVEDYNIWIKNISKVGNTYLRLN